MNIVGDAARAALALAVKWLVDRVDARYREGGTVTPCVTQHSRSEQSPRYSGGSAPTSTPTTPTSNNPET